MYLPLPYLSLTLTFSLPYLFTPLYVLTASLPTLILIFYCLPPPSAHLINDAPLPTYKTWVWSFCVLQIIVLNKTHFLKIENLVESKNETSKKYFNTDLLASKKGVHYRILKYGRFSQNTLYIIAVYVYLFKLYDEGNKLTIYRKSVIRLNTHVIIVCRIRSNESAHSAEIRPRGWPWNRLKTRLSNAQSQSTSQQSPSGRCAARRDTFYNILPFPPLT